MNIKEAFINSNIWTYNKINNFTKWYGKNIDQIKNPKLSALCSKNIERIARIISALIFAPLAAIAKLSLACYSKQSIQNAPQGGIKFTKEGLPITHPKIIGAVYQEMKALDQILDKYGVRYWLEGGSVIGLVRHGGGIFPWDDDADIHIHPDDCPKLKELFLSKDFQNELEAMGFKLIDHWQGWKFVPLTKPEHGGECYSTSTNNGKGGKFFTPCIDLFETKRVENFYDENTKRDRTKFILNEKATETFPTDYFFEDEIYNHDGKISKVRFGPIKVSAPREKRAHLIRQYGNDVFTHTFKTFSHVTGQALSLSSGRRKKVKIETLSQAEWEPNKAIKVEI